VTFDRPRAWSVHNGGPIELLFTCTLDPVPDGTRLTAEFQPTRTACSGSSIRSFA
jgi:hypothetical protein